MRRRRIHIVGRKNSGKTTLVVDLVRHLAAMGFRVATIKHTHHRHELDVPGKDSFRHREAGATAVGILSPAMNAVFWPTEGDEDSSAPQDRYETFAALFDDCDLILVEGDSRTDAIKVEVWHEAVSSPPLALEDTSIQAVVTDSPIAGSFTVWPRRDIPALAERLLRLAQQEGG